ncbi:hypothetical protein BLNAU_9364 [Blattamonas nauphoetae]|uniref:Uncharacterized protein n=1 Tax=Blattamonas nauphoetae TaxID=2049346 RepID=A0ABQ9XW25_9EUKA|nr:hypothetical protein BLNAU_9364 [Blattamonas nauphoetae]
MALKLNFTDISLVSKLCGRPIRKDNPLCTKQDQLPAGLLRRDTVRPTERSRKVPLQLMDSSIQMTPSSGSKREGYAHLIHWMQSPPLLIQDSEERSGMSVVHTSESTPHDLLLQIQPSSGTLVYSAVVSVLEGDNLRSNEMFHSGTGMTFNLRKKKRRSDVHLQTLSNVMRHSAIASHAAFIVYFRTLSLKPPTSSLTNPHSPESGQSIHSSRFTQRGRSNSTTYLCTLSSRSDSRWLTRTLLDDPSVVYVSEFGTLVHQLELLAEDTFVMSLMRVVASFAFKAVERVMKEKEIEDMKTANFKQKKLHPPPPAIIGLQPFPAAGSPPIAESVSLVLPHHLIPATIGLTPERDLVFYFGDFAIQPICVVATINLMQSSYSESDDYDDLTSSSKVKEHRKDRKEKKKEKDGGKKNKGSNEKTENVMMKNLVGQHRREGDALQRLLRHKSHRQHAPTRLVHQLPLLIAADTEHCHAVHLAPSSVIPVDF